MGASSEHLVRSRHLGRLNLGDGRALITHVLGRTRVTADERVLQLLDAFALPHRPAELASTGVPAGEVPVVVDKLRSAYLLRAAGSAERERVRHAYAFPLRPPDPWFDLGEAVGPGADGSADQPLPPLVSLGDRLVLSRALATAPLDGAEWLVTHPLGHPLHIDGALWELAQRFAEPAPVGEDVAVCEFLLRRKVLWTSAEAERAAGRREAAAPESESLHISYPPANRWRQRFLAYRLADIVPAVAVHRVALVGACQSQLAAEALEWLGQRWGWHIDVTGFLSAEPALGAGDWSLVVLPAGQFCAGFYEAVAAEDSERCRRFIPALFAQVDHAVDRVRAFTAAPLLVTAVTQPGLSATGPATPFATFLAGVLADLNGRIADRLSPDADAWLLDEERLVARSAVGAYWDDEFNALPHHAAVSNWSWVPLKPRVADGPVDRAELDAQRPAASAVQADPAAVLAGGLLSFLRRLHGLRQVRLVVFEPNDLLWDGRLEDRDAPYTSPPHFFADVGEFLHAGAHEALSVLRRRGVLLACRSTCPSELLEQRWRIQSPVRHVVRFDDLAAVCGGEHDDLATVLARCGVSEEETLLVDFLRDPPPGFRGRVFGGPRPSLRRYLLTDPALHPSRSAGAAALAEDAPRPSPEPTVAAARHALTDGAIATTVDSVLGSVLGSTPSDVRVDDLRLLGLDSLGAVEVMVGLEHQLGITFDDHDFTESVAFFRGPLEEAVVRGLQRLAERGPDGGIASRPMFDGLGYDDWCAQDVASLILANERAPRGPWQFKFLRSPRPYDYEYVTWRQLVEQALGYTAAYRSAGLVAGDVVAIVASQGPELVAAFVGAIIGRFVPSVVAPPRDRRSANGVAASIGQTTTAAPVRLVVTDAAVAETIAGSLAAAAPHLPVLTDRPPPGSPDGGARPRGDGPLLLQHSSGTTGRKKGILLDDRAALAQIWDLGQALALGGDDRLVTWLPMYHDMGLICCTLLPLVCSVPTVVMSPHDWVRNPHLLLQQISEDRSTLCWMPNFALSHSARRVADRNLRGVDLSSLRAIVIGAEPVTAAAQQAFHRRFAPYGLRHSALTAGYGLAEAAAAVTQSSPGRAARRVRVMDDDFRRGRVARPAPSGVPAADTTELVSLGPVLEHTTVEVIDADGRRVADGHVGEIRLRGDSVAAGYVDDPAATEQAFRDGWVYPGDEGFFLDGELFVTGRRDDVAIVAGCNIHPHEVEEAVSALDGIRPGRVVAFGVDDERAGTQQLVVMAEIAEGEGRADVAGRVRAAALEACGVGVHDVRLFDRRVLLKSTSGKLSRSRNRELYLSGDGR